MKLDTDLIIIGAGIAGVSAAVYARRAGLEFLLFEPKSVGGQLAFIEHIDNYVGLGIGSKGSELGESLKKAIDKLNINLVAEEIEKVTLGKKSAEAFSGRSSYNAKALIVASGAAFKKLGLNNEDNFCGKGISYCAVCDGFFFKNKDIAVVGGGNSAVEEALYLADICRKVYLIHRRNQLRAIDYLQKALRIKNNIEIIFESVVREIKGKDFLESIIIENVQSRKESVLSVQGLFVAIGISPNTDIFKNVISLDEDKFILTDEEMKTSCDFIWACGDCRKRPLRQLITAASEGAIAAISAYKYLKGTYISA